MDAICVPANIRYPQDISLLNESREKLETIIYRFCKSYGLLLPRRYSKRARKDYLAFAKSKKHSAKQIRKEYQDKSDRIKVEHMFAISDRCYGMGEFCSKELTIFMRGVTFRKLLLQVQGLL